MAGIFQCKQQECIKKVAKTSSWSCGSAPFALLASRKRSRLQLESPRNTNARFLRHVSLYVEMEFPEFRNSKLGSITPSVRRRHPSIFQHIGGAMTTNRTTKQDDKSRESENNKTINFNHSHCPPGNEATDAVVAVKGFKKKELRVCVQCVVLWERLKCGPLLRLCNSWLGSLFLSLDGRLLSDCVANSAYGKRISVAYVRYSMMGSSCWRGDSLLPAFSTLL
jgi:hypothetical protein